MSTSPTKREQYYFSRRSICQGYHIIKKKKMLNAVNIECIACDYCYNEINVAKRGTFNSARDKWTREGELEGWSKNNGVNTAQMSELNHKATSCRLR